MLMQKEPITNLAVRWPCPNTEAELSLAQEMPRKLLTPRDRSASVTGAQRTGRRRDKMSAEKHEVTCLAMPLPRQQTEVESSLARPSIMKMAPARGTSTSVTGAQRTGFKWEQTLMEKQLVTNLAMPWPCRQKHGAGRVCVCEFQAQTRVDVFAVLLQWSVAFSKRRARPTQLLVLARFDLIIGTPACQNPVFVKLIATFFRRPHDEIDFFVGRIGFHNLDLASDLVLDIRLFLLGGLIQFHFVNKLSSQGSIYILSNSYST